MDVSATGPAVAAAVSQANVDATTGIVVTPAPQEAAEPVQTQATSTSNDPHAQGTSFPTQPGNRSALAPAIAKLFSAVALREPVSLNVSYRVERDPNIIVTVFTDPKTGEEVAQIPPEVLVHLAQFFDQQHGATLDQSA